MNLTVIVSISPRHTVHITVIGFKAVAIKRG